MAANYGPADGFQEENVLRLPLAVALEPRIGKGMQQGVGTATKDRDSAIINGYFEPKTDSGDPHVVKRPGRSIWCEMDQSTQLRMGLHYYHGRNELDAAETLALVYGSTLWINPEGSDYTGEFAWSSQGTAPWATSTGGFANTLQIVHISTTSKIAVVSGRGGLRSVYKTADSGLNWALQTSAPGWVARADFRCDQISGPHILIMGGRNAAGTLLNDVWISSDEGVTWTQQTAAASWPAREKFGTANVGGIIYVAGGTGASGDLNDVWETTDLGASIGQNWFNTVASAPWAARHSFGMSRNFGEVHSTTIMICGGTDGTTNFVDAWTGVFGDDWVRETDTMPFSATALSSLVASSGGAGTAEGRWIAARNSSFAFAEGNLPGIWHPYTSLSTLVTVDGAFETVMDGISTGSAINAIRKINLSPFYERKFTGLFPGGTKAGIQFSGDVDLIHFEDVPLPDLNKSSALQEGRFTSNPPLEGFFINSTRDAYFYNTKSRSLSKVTSPNYPFITTGGAAWLNGRFHIMTPEGRIYCSGINDPLSWSALDFINAIMHSDRGQGVYRRHTYIMACGTSSTEWFYDSGSSPGNPLRRVDSAAHDFGVLDSQSVVQIADMTLFAGFMENSREVGVFSIGPDGYVPKRISTPFIDRLIANSDFDCIWAYPIFHEGHRFYIMNACCIDFSLVHDLDTGGWFLWTTTDAFIMDAPILTAALNTSVGLVEVTVDDATMAPASVGDPIIVEGATQTEYNGSFVVSSVVDSSTFKYTLPTSTVPTTPATGTILVKQIQEVLMQDWTTAYSVAGPSSGQLFPLTRTYLLDKTNGNIYLLDNEVSSDRVGVLIPVFGDSATEDTSFIDFTIRTGRFDAGNSMKKFISRVEMVGDNINLPILVRYSDDDYTTWSPYRQIDLSLGRNRLSRQGSMRRRAYEIRQPYTNPDTTICRVADLEMFYKQGTNV